ncbi:MAG: ABC transporter substrate-binding protein [Elusimicrobia bacterium]|nr:ABC transporter substrate-binding protein [Elusimicrobiota bacterium]
MRRTLLSAVLVAGLASARAQAAAKNPDTFTYLTISDADSMDPAWAYDTASDLVILNVYETLFMFDKSSTQKLVPLLATEIPTKRNGLISPDGRTYVIPLRKGVAFQDGTPMTPEDVRYSILRFMLQDRAGGPSALLLQPLLGYPSTRGKDGKILPDVWRDATRAVSVRGDDLVLRLPRPYAPLLSILASWSPVVSQAWAAKNGDWDGREETWQKYNDPEKQSSPFFERADGTGPFKLDRWDRRNEEFILVRNDGYWRKPARLKNVVIKGINEFGTRKLMLEAGDADSIYADRPLLSQLRNLPGVQIIDNLPTMEMDPVVFFTYRANPVANPYIGTGRLGDGIPPDFFADKDVRKAFAYAFDYKGFIRDVERGKGSQATGPIPPGLLGHDPRGPKYRLDLKRAAAHMRKALGGQAWRQGFHFTIAFNSGNLARQTICQILKHNVEGLNPKFKIDCRAVEWSTFLDAYESSKLPIFVMGWNADYPDPSNFVFPLLDSKGAFAPAQKFSNPEFDRLIDEGNAEIDPAKRREIYEKLQRLVYDEVPQLYIVDTVRYRTQRSWVRGWYPNPIFPDSPYGSYFYTIWKE